MSLQRHTHEQSTTHKVRRQILAISSLLKKPKADDKDLQHFKTKVSDERKRLTDLLEQRKRES